MTRILHRKRLGREALALILAALAGDVAAMAPRMSIGPGDAQCVAYVLIEDRSGWYQETETLATDYGPVSVRYQTVGGHAAPDIAEVVSTPHDLVAVPPVLELVPSEINRICLVLYVGA